MLHKKNKVLIIDDDHGVLEILEQILGNDYEVLTADTYQSAKEITNETDFQVALVDIKLPDGNGMDILKEIKQINDDIAVIVITSHQEVSLAVEAVQFGAYDFLDKDFDPEKIKNLVANAMSTFLRRKKIQYLESEMDQFVASGLVMSQSPKMKKVYEMTERAAEVPANVLITGESGTGKELIARRIHDLSPNKAAPFVAVNVAAIPENLIESTLFGHEKGSFTGAHRLQYGKFELADTGTLFLDEIGELRVDLQATLLRALQENYIERVGGNKQIPVNVRVIAATNVDLEKKVEKNLFREDLFYRLNVLRIHLPPLRDRTEDIPELVRFFIKKYNKKFNRNVKDTSDLVINVFSRYSWPGNVRELENIIERLIALAEKPIITESDIPVEYLVNDFEALKKRASGGDVLAEATAAFEKSFILKVLETVNWNQTKAADQLGIHRKTLEYKIKKYAIGPIITQKRPLTR